MDSSRRRHGLVLRLRERSKSDAAAATGVVPVLILMAAFSLIAILIATWLDLSVKNKAADAAACVESVNVYTDADICGESHGENHSFTKDVGYQNRY